MRGARPGDPVEQLRTLIDEYNAGSLNVDEMLRRLQSLSREPSADEAHHELRAVGPSLRCSTF